jgi:hypothetical protein
MTTRDDNGTTTRYCRRLESFLTPVVPVKVLECTDYVEKNKPSRHEMERQAYIIDTQALRKGKPGFVAPGTERHMRIRGVKKGPFNIEIDDDDDDDNDDGDVSKQ